MFPQASPLAGLATCFVMCVDLSCPHWMESSLKRRTLCLLFPLCPQQQVYDHTAGAQKACQMHEVVNISSASRLPAIENAASGPLHMLFLLLSVCFPSYLHNQFCHFTLLSASSSVKPSLTILAEIIPFPHPFLASCSTLFFSWHVLPCNGIIGIHVFTFHLPPGLCALER